jgi:hypothetical protein
MTGWAGDLLLGCRLALAGGRRQLGRMVLIAVSTGLGVAVLLLAASVPVMWNARLDRPALVLLAAQPSGPADPPGVVPLHIAYAGTEYRGEQIDGFYLRGDAGALVPPGIDRLPGPGEVYLSPALARLLGSEQGALLRPRFPQRVAGTIGRVGLSSPGEYLFYAGTTSTDGLGGVGGVGGVGALEVLYGFGGGPYSPLPPQLWLLLVLGVVALLVPVLLVVATAGRAGALSRDRRLAALRLVGAGAGQVRRIAAGEALLGALAGLAFGGLLFLAGRQLAESVPVYGQTFFRADVHPAWSAVVLIALAVPLLAVLVAVLALRRMAIEPLGVVRQATATRRRLWWRLACPVLGVLLLDQAGPVDEFRRGGSRDTAVLVAGISLLLLTVPLLLPWLVERLVRVLRPNSVPFQLAVGRLRLDGDAPARVVGGVAVVLAGAIALQSTLIAAGQPRDGAAEARPAAEQWVVRLDGSVPAGTSELRRALATVPGVTPVAALADLPQPGGPLYPVWLAGCADVRALLAVAGCADGDVYQVRGDAGRPGTRPPPPPLPRELTFAAGRPDRSGPRWTVPARVPEVAARPGAEDLSGGFVVTPGALRGAHPLVGAAVLRVVLASDDPDLVERLRNAVAPFGWRAAVETRGGVPPDQTERQYRTIRTGLLLGALVTLLLAGASLLALAVEQVMERRRQVAVLSASGVPRGVLARSVLWQNALPMALAVPVAVLTGVALSRLLLRLIDRSPAVDWAGTGVLVAASALLVLAATALTLPALHRASQPTELRAE